ncbi:MAG: hypothetical protein E7599_01925 [Ruminococcaceae bacterium]|nr:hypothetical protein [Oscillospiraceae bacterium]
MLMPLAACGKKADKEKTLQESDALTAIVMTVAKSSQVGTVFEKVTQVTDEFYGTTETEILSFLAYDEKGALYRIPSGRYDTPSAGEEIVVTYDPAGSPIQASGKDTDKAGVKIDYELKAYWVWTKWEWELKKTADKLVQEACGLPLSCLRVRYERDKNGNYEFGYTVMLGGFVTDEQHKLLLSTTGKHLGSRCSEKEYSKYIGTDVEKAIPEAIKRIKRDSGNQDPYLYFEINEDDGCLYLCSEEIVHLKPGDRYYEEDGLDHLHEFYREKLG